MPTLRVEFFQINSKKIIIRKKCVENVKHIKNYVNVLVSTGNKRQTTNT